VGQAGKFLRGKNFEESIIFEAEANNRQKIIRISTMDASNKNIVNERADRCEETFRQLWLLLSEFKGFVAGIANKLFVFATSGFLQG
jgi:hypothetical protein